MTSDRGGIQKPSRGGNRDSSLKTWSGAARPRQRRTSGTGPGALASPFAAPKTTPGGGVRTTLVQRVHQTLLDGFDEGIFQPGQRIKAAELANRLGLSRAPVREALHVLAGQGLVELHPDKGAILRELKLDDLIEIYEVSGPIIIIGVVAAAARIHEGDNAERVRRALDRIKAAAALPPSHRFYDYLGDFHVLLNQIGEKPYVDYALSFLNLDYWHRYLAEAIDLERHIPGYVANYLRLGDAVLAGDGPAAAAIVSYHVNWSMTLLRNHKPA